MSTTKMPSDDFASMLEEGGAATDEHVALAGDTCDARSELESNLTCYCRGTLIRTAAGDAPIEDLRIGDCVLTASGEVRPIRWLGSRGVDCTRHPNPALVWPIRIQAGAFGQDQPARDLWVSPFHSILVEGALIQAHTLVNNASVAQVPCAQTEYWHVELDSHDILLAEGLPGESYLDVGNRTAFINGGAFVEAYPDFRPKHWTETCVPVAKGGAAVQSAKAALLARAKLLGHVMTEDPDVHVLADGQRIEPIRLGEQRLTFILPATAATLELRCRSFIPTHFDPASDDQRSLGICVDRLQFDGAEVALDNDDAFAYGWHRLELNPEGRPWRWSCDRAPLPLGTRLVVIDIAGPGRYWANPTRSAIPLCG
jgi:hypothetical protein